MKPSCDLLLINPGGRGKVYQKLASELAAVEPPVWVGLIATYARQKGLAVQILDANADNRSPAETAKYVVDCNPTLAAVVVYGHQPSASTQTMPAAGAICREVKELSAEQKLLLVGGHVAALPERTLREEAADFVSAGEGPVTVCQLVEALKSPHPDYSKVLGLCYWDGPAVKVNPPAALIKDLDREMPGLAWDLLDLEKYRAHNWHCFGGIERQPYACLYTTLGCPYHCSFCCIQAPFKTGERVLGYKESVNSYRYWSPQTIIGQIDYLVNRYGVRNFKFADEMFVLNKSHVIGICDLIIERKYDLNIWAYARIDTCEESMLAKLRQAGFTWLGIGVESASQYVRDGVEKNFGKKDILKTLEKVRQAGINIGANFIFGLPDDTLETMRDTLDMAIEICPEWANFYCAMAYPGSRLYEMAVQRGWELPENWIGYSQHSFETLPLRTERLTSAEVLKFRDEAFLAFFTHPKYLSYVETRFGQETADHVRHMTDHRLERKFV
jgi:radical SAM superfamily enzyme YgiQ (UPF0313 family)